MASMWLTAVESGVFITSLCVSCPHCRVSYLCCGVMSREQPCVPSSLHPLGVRFLAEVAQHVRTFRGPRHSGVLKSSDFQPGITSNIWQLRAVFRGRMCVLIVTHNPVTRSLRTRRTSAFSRQKAAAWCHLVTTWGPCSWQARAGGGLERGRVGKFTSQQQNHFWSVSS